MSAITIAAPTAMAVPAARPGALFVPATTAAYRGLRNEAIPRATSAVRIFQQVGGSFGTAVLAVILQHQAASHAGTGSAGLATAFGHTFWWAVGFTALALVSAMLLPGTRQDQASATTAASAPPQGSGSVMRGGGRGAPFARTAR